jgi:hypothetical protein
VIAAVANTKTAPGMSLRDQPASGQIAAARIGASASIRPAPTPPALPEQPVRFVSIIEQPRFRLRDIPATARPLQARVLGRGAPQLGNVPR